MTAYTPVPTVNTGDLWTAANHNTYLRDNFAAGVPDIFTTKGDLAVASAADAAGRLGVGADKTVLGALASETLGLKWLTNHRALIPGVASALAQFDTTSTTYVDITSASISLVTTLTSTILLVASGIWKADNASYSAYLQGVINGVEAGDGRIRKDGADGIAWCPLGYTFYQTAVAAGTIVCKLQLKTSNAIMTARTFGVVMWALAISE